MSNGCSMTSTCDACCDVGILWRHTHVAGSSSGESYSSRELGTRGKTKPRSNDLLWPQQDDDPDVSENAAVKVMNNMSTNNKQ